MNNLSNKNIFSGTIYNVVSEPITFKKINEAVEKFLNQPIFICGYSNPHITTPKMWDSDFAYCIACGHILKNNYE